MKVNENLKKKQYIFFCYNIKLTPFLKNNLNKNHITYSFFKKLKCINYLKFVQLGLSNSLVIFFCDNELACHKIISQISDNIIFAKIQTNYYSLNNLSKYCKLDSKAVCYQNIVNSYYKHILVLMQLLENQRNF